VIGLENGKISLSSKQLKRDPWAELPKHHKIGDILEGEVIRYVPYGVFVRVFDDINGLIHLSELSQKQTQNPNEVVKLGQIVQAKIILLDPKNRKIGLSMKGVNEEKSAPAEAKPVSKVPAKATESESATEAPAKKPAAKAKGLEGVVKKISDEKIAEKLEKSAEKKTTKKAK
jgi:ribosomal protein S1